MTWREDYADQNLRMAQKMLEQQGEVNEARRQLAAALRVVDAVRALAEFCRRMESAALTDPHHPLAPLLAAVDEFDQTAPTQETTP